MIRLDILVLDHTSPSSVGITTDVLSAANRLAGRRLFDRRVLGVDAPSVRLRGGMTIEAQPLTTARARDVVVLPGLGAATPEEIGVRLAQPDAQVAAEWLRKAWAQGATVASSCSGVFVLAQAGLLEGRRCTSTWWLVPLLKAASPGCEATLDAMVTEHDRVWTAGASLAHIDLMLGLVAHFAGPALAGEVARHLVVEPRASQARFVAPAFLAAHDPLAGRVEQLVRQRLANAPSLNELADEVAVSPRTLARRLAAATGLTPMRFVQKIRVDAALHALQTTRTPIDQIARDVGFEDASALYRLMQRHTGKPPSAFRRAEAF